MRDEAKELSELTQNSIYSTTDRNHSNRYFSRR